MGLINIDNRIIGSGNEPFIIAEAGINHNGDMNIARKMIEAAKQCGADAVKFQTFKAKDFILDDSVTYTYKSQGKTITEPIIDMFERCEFSEDQWIEIKKYCDNTGILFLSSPGNVSDMELLISIGAKAIKVGSDDFVNIPLIRRYARENVPLLLSCGMATEEEIEATLLAAGIDQGKEICLFLCTSEYPTPPEDVNVLKLASLRDKYPDLTLGFSDHTIGSTAAIMAVACGASVFEKHFTLDHELPGPDHWFSETPDSLHKWVSGIREAHKMLGSSDLKPTETEIAFREEAHRSITTSKTIRKGDIFSEDNLCMRRPGTGLAGNMWDKIIGKTAARDIPVNTQLTPEDIKNDQDR